MYKAVIFFLLLVLVPSGAGAQQRVLNLLYTGALRGELEPCGCSPKSNSGGLARLSGYINSSAQGLSPYLLIDAGNSLGDDTAQGRLKSAVVLKSFAAIGYSVAAFSTDDTARLKGPLGALVDGSGLAVISKSSAYPNSVWIEEGSVRVNISADPEAYAADRLNILLFEGSVAEAEKQRGWDVIILSSGELLKEPVEADGTLIVSGYPRGEKLGVLTLSADGNGRVAGFTHRWQTLGKETEEDRKVRSLIDGYDTEVARLLRDEERQVPSARTFFGYKSCVECHQPFFEQWSGTRHSRAFASLEAVGKAKDPECVMCHTTGYGAQGGFYSATSTPGLKNIQCEQCHGAGKEHIADYSAPMAPVGQPVCLRCHTDENSPDFDYKIYLQKIKH